MELASSMPQRGSDQEERGGRSSLTCSRPCALATAGEGRRKRPRRQHHKKMFEEADTKVLPVWTTTTLFETIFSIKMSAYLVLSSYTRLENRAMKGSMLLMKSKKILMWYIFYTGHMDFVYGDVGYSFKMKRCCGTDFKYFLWILIQTSK